MEATLRRITLAQAPAAVRDNYRKAIDNGADVKLARIVAQGVDVPIDAVVVTTPDSWGPPTAIWCGKWKYFHVFDAQKAVQLYLNGQTTLTFGSVVPDPDGKP